MAKTRILTLMFHRVNDANQHLSPLQFADYLAYLVNNFPIILPGEPPPDCPLAICLTFDDAYYDFYHDVFPLLKQFNIKALVAVPVKYILSHTTLSSETRLNVSYPHGMEQNLYQEKAPFCTWHELREMAHSNHVIIASHGYAHHNLTEKTTHLAEEIISSKEILETQLNVTIQHFVYPFGKTTRFIHKKVRAFYRYGIRISGALNRGWDQRGFIYRLNAESLWIKGVPISATLIRQLTLKYWRNRLRFI